MNFVSDTAAPAHPRVLEAMTQANTGTAASYGGDPLTASLRQVLADVFETNEFEFWMCASGTAANALALSVLCPPTGAILCHEEAHIERDERGAPEFFTGGGKLRLLPGIAGQIDETALRQSLSAVNPAFVHETPAQVLSLTNLTECGTAYPSAQIAHLSALAKASGLSVHLDGARLANALASTGATPAQMTWQASIDIVTLGLTKTGAVGCEIIVLFGDMRARIEDLKARAKRAGHMPPKMRYMAAQATALLADGLWLDLAKAANTAAADLAGTLCASPGVSLLYPVHGNEVFVRMPEGLRQALIEAGVGFADWPGDAQRFVCSWNTDPDTLSQFRAVCSKAKKIS